MTITVIVHSNPILESSQYCIRMMDVNDYINSQLDIIVKRVTEVKNVLCVQRKYELT